MMRPFASTISLEEARRRLHDAIEPMTRTERVRLADAAGRVAVRDVASALDVPPFARSAMDGYALVSADTAGASRDAPSRLRIVERIYTGQPPSRAIKSGECAEIATGAPVPAGADAVVMVEETEKTNDGEAAIFTCVRAGQNISPRGADISAATS
jgi:molybdopterin biosynthesis enzyme